MTLILRRLRGRRNEERLAVVQFLSHPIFGHANVAIECFRDFLL